MAVDFSGQTQGKKIAFIGCGQLAKMMAESAIGLGVITSFLAEPNENTTCVDGLGIVVVRTDEHTPEQLYAALGEPDIITLEREQVDLQFLRALEHFCVIHPNLNAMAAAQDRLKERTELTRLGIPVAHHVFAKEKNEFVTKASSLTPPLFIKHPTLGYDGNHQWRAKTRGDLETLDLPSESFPLLVEQAVPFECEASIIAARSSSGEIALYPATVNTHVEGILVKSSVASDESLKERLSPAYEYMNTLLKAWDYVGVLTIELFVTGDGIVVNEIAPRVHNSGHWTMDGCASSQFENHIRAILGASLGDTTAKMASGMVNLLGVDAFPEVLLTENDRVHWYKKSVRPRRKMGHVNLVDENESALKSRQTEMIEKIYGNFNALQKA